MGKPAMDHIRYDLLTQSALRGVIRRVLAEAAVKGLPGNHHFFITFDTGAEGVRMSPRLKASYPEEMTVVLQHQFWDLAVGEDDFEVGLAFNGIPERLHVPLQAIKAFFDPSVQFGLQFQAESDTAEAASGDAAAVPDLPPAPPAPEQDGDLKPAPKKKGGKQPAIAPVKARAKPIPVGSAGNAEPARPTGKDDSAPAAPAAPAPAAPAGEVVRLDRFRKK